MKKIIGFLILFIISFNSFSQTGVATASQQTREALLLKYISDKLDSVVNALGGSISTTLTASPSSVTTSGTITAGARYILLETSSDFVGTINGMVFQANGFLPYPICPDTRWPAIPYTVTAGTLFIRKFN